MLLEVFGTDYWLLQYLMLYGTLHDSYSFWYITKEKKKIFGIHKWIMSDIVYLCEPFLLSGRSRYICYCIVLRGKEGFATTLWVTRVDFLPRQFMGAVCLASDQASKLFIIIVNYAMLLQDTALL